MQREIRVRCGSTSLVFGVTEAGEVRLWHAGRGEFGGISDWYAPVEYDEFRAVEVQIAGRHHDYGHGTKNIGTSEGRALCYESHTIAEQETGVLLTLVSRSDAVRVTQFYRLYEACGAVRAWTEVENLTPRALPLEYVSSFVLYGLERRSKARGYDGLTLGVPYHSNYREYQWQSYPLGKLGLVPGNRYASSAGKICFSNSGTWTCKQNLPMGYLIEEGGGVTLFQVDVSGSWSWEIGDHNGCLYLALSGPTMSENGWLHTLEAGGTFASCPAELVFADTIDGAFAALTRYRRLARRRRAVAQTIVYNNYMHDAGETPTGERTLAAVEGVADLDIDVFCLDAGWHDEGEGAAYWKALGGWRESKTRYPEGLGAVLDRIRALGMQPGLWLEPEIMGYACPERGQLADDCYFCRGGGVIANNGRLNLDFTQPAVRARQTAVLERILLEYRPAYLKFDYNADAGPGTDAHAASYADGLLAHTRAYRAWLEELLERHPSLTLENCASGGLRLDAPMLETADIHSTSDQTDYLLYAYLCSNMLTAGPPEQMGVWCYPLTGQDDEAVIWNVVNTSLGRIQLSGHTPYLDGDKKALIREGLALHRAMADCKARAVPFWPLGLNEFGADTVCCGITDGATAYLALWRLAEEAGEIAVPITAGRVRRAENAYPKDFRDVTYRIENGDRIVFSMPGRRARLVRLTLE